MNRSILEILSDVLFAEVPEFVWHTLLFLGVTGFWAILIEIIANV